MSSQKFFGALAEKNNGGNGDMEVSAREFEGVRISALKSYCMMLCMLLCMTLCMT